MRPLLVLAAALLAAAAHTLAAHVRHTDNAQRGGAWTLHAPHDRAPCGNTDGTAPCHFVPSPLAGPGLINPLVHAFERQWDDAHASVSLSRSSNETVLPRISLRVSSTEIGHLDKLQVSYQLHGSSRGTARDWIGAYCLDDDGSDDDGTIARSLPDSEYMDWRWTDGSVVATIEFGPLTNMRCAWQFRFFTADSNIDTGGYTKLTQSKLVRFRGGPTAPQQVHLAMTEDVTVMRVSWTSAAAHNASVWFGPGPENLLHVAVAPATTYHASDMCGAPATTVAAQFFRDPGMLYDALMRNLTSGTRYYYRVGSDRDGLSSVFSFTTPPLTGTQRRITSFFVFGDLGDWDIKATGPKPADRTETTVELLRQDVETEPEHDYLAVFHVGDLAYAMGWTYLSLASQGIPPNVFIEVNFGT